MAIANRPAANRPAADPPGQGNDRHFVTALARGLQVLRCFRSGEELLGNQQLAERCGLPKSTVTRLSYTPTRLGYLHHDTLGGLWKPEIDGIAVPLALGNGLPDRVLSAARPPAAEASPHVASLLPSAGDQPPNSRLNQAPMRASRPCGAGAASTSGTTTV